jgi:hypothetical protein
VAWRPGETPEDFLREADLALHDRKLQPRPHWAEAVTDSGGDYDTTPDLVSRYVDTPY